MKVKGFWIVLLVFCMNMYGEIKVKSVPTADGGGVVRCEIENNEMVLILNADRGARVQYLLDKKTNKNIVYWNEQSGEGGLFDDRHTFTDIAYATKIEKGENIVNIICEAKSPDGIKIKKQFTIGEGPLIKVNYTIQNYSHKPFTFWIRNFGVPNGELLTEKDTYFFVKEGELISKAFVSGHQENISDGWFAIINKELKGGFGVVTEYNFVDRFYFWQGSKIYPTFEWIYSPIPPGKEYQTDVLFVLLHNVEEISAINEKGEIDSSMKVIKKTKQAVKFKDIPGWKPLVELYSPTGEEKDIGFIIVDGEGEDVLPRLKEIEVDLGRNEYDMVPINIFGLSKQRIKFEIEGEGKKLCSPYIEENYKLIPGEETDLYDGIYKKVWIKASSGENKSGIYSFKVKIMSGEGKIVKIPGKLTIWDVKLPDERKIGMKPCAWIVSLTGEEIEKEEVKKKLEVFLKNLSELRVTVCDWAYPIYSFLPRVKVKGTDKTLAQYAKENKISVENLPELDFSFYDPWIKGSVKYGLTRFELNDGAPSWREANFLKSLTGESISPESEEGWKILSWFYSQFRDYLKGSGMKDIWVKIGDEISPEYIPTYVKNAKKFNSIGYKSYTTNTGHIPRSAEFLNQMNQASDEWRVALCLTRDFLNLTRKSYGIEQYEKKVETKWSKYTNGGAIDTWHSQKIFDAEQESEIEKLEVFYENEPLKFKGGSGWGNKEKGVFMLYGGYIYISLPDGSDPNGKDIEMKYLKRVEKGNGEPLVKLEPTDEFWYYGGGNYTQPYTEARKYGWRTIYLNAKGYGFWTYWWWDPKYRVVWYDETKGEMINSPAYEGLKDGNEDATYYLLLKEYYERTKDEQGLKWLEETIIGKKNSILKVGETIYHAYIYDDLVRISYSEYNKAKKEILQRLSQIK